MAKRRPKPSPPDTADEARARALRWLKLRDRSIEELRQRLSALDFSEATIAEALARLKAERLIDDARLAEHAVDRNCRVGLRRTRCLSVALGPRDRGGADPEGDRRRDAGPERS